MTDIVSEVEAGAGALVKTATTFATGHWLIIGAVMGAFALGGAGAGYATYKIMDDKIARMELADQKALTDAVTIKGLMQHDADVAGQEAAVDLAKRQQALEDQGKQTIVRIPTYVTKLQDAHNCVTWGLVRVHDAAALGVDPSSLNLPSGVTNDTCSPFVSSQLAERITLNYTAALHDANQLDAVTAYDAKLDAITKPKPAEKGFWDKANPLNWF